MLASFGFSCYLEGTMHLVKLTDGCWDPRLEIRQWSNVWCLSTRTRVGLLTSLLFDEFIV
jgi:hypothetical protein